MVEKGLKGVSSLQVEAHHTAKVMGSGDMEVFATPAMVALMENAAMRAVASELPEGSSTVGASIEVPHIRPTALGDEVTATAELIETEGRKLTFRVEASDRAGVIGNGTHIRYVVDRERFLAKLR